MRDCLNLEVIAVKHAGRKMLMKEKSRPLAISMKVRGGVKDLEGKSLSSDVHIFCVSVLLVSKAEASL